MVNFLDKILSVLQQSQKVAIKSLIAAKTAVGEVSSVRAKQQEAALIFNRIKAKLNNILLDPRYVSSDEKISSGSHNQNMEEIFLDLNALYSAIDNLASVNKKQGISLNSDYDKSKATIEKLINDVKVYSLRKQHPEFNEVKLIDFNSSTNLNKKQPVALIDPNIRLLQLKPLLSNRAHLTNRTTRTTKIYTKTYSQGLKGQLSTSFPPENMVDQRPETFWGTIILAESPVVQIYEKNTASGEPYSVGINGPVVEVFFKFSHSEKINTIKILPFSEFPIRIIDVSYRPTSASQVFVPIPDFTDVTTLDWEELNFSPVLATEIRITIAQENYKKVSYLLPKSVVVNTDIFQRILNLRASKIIGASILDSDFSLYVLNTISTYENAILTLQDLYKNSGVDMVIQPNIEYYNDIQALFQKAYSELSPVRTKEIVNNLLSNESLQQPDPENVSINKYEYLLGLREVEINYQLYYPISYYESEQYLPQATVSELQIEVDERHTEFATPWQSDYRKTSTEWEVDIGDGRRIPIHPINIVDNIDDIPAVKDERLEFDLATNKAYTRVGGYYGTPYRLKKNGDLIPTEFYRSQRVTGSIPKIEVTLTGSWFDISSIYTIDYAVDPSSYNINILDKFNSEPLSSPEIFTGVGSDNEINLSKFPFINYEVVNMTGFFKKNPDKSEWKFIPPQLDIVSGQLLIYPAIEDNVGNLLQSGSVTGLLFTGIWGERSGQNFATLSGNPNLSLNYFGDIRGVEFGYFLKIMDNTAYGEIDAFTTTNQFRLVSPIHVTEEQCRRWDSYATGVVLSGSLVSPVSGYLRVDYTIGVGVKTDGQIFALSDLIYDPLTVTIGSREAKNITNYETLIHPAFSIANSKDNEIEYIHAGRKLYFSQKFNNQEIRVFYNWLTEFISIQGKLRNNTAINPDLSPKVNEIKVFLNNLII